MEIEQLVDDFNIVKGQQRRVTDRYALDRFFASDPDLESIRHISTLPEECVEKLSNFIVAEFMDPAGNWIDIGVTDRAMLKDAAELRHTFAAHLTNSNFYTEIKDVIRNGLIYRQGMLDISYEGCLSFTSIDSESIYVSNDKNIANTRVYSEVLFSGMDLREKFTNLHPEFDEPSDGLKDSVATQYFETVSCIVPNKSKRGYKWKKLWFLAGKEDRILETKEKGEFYKTLPVVSYKLAKKKSLAELCMSPALILEEYERTLLSYASKAAEPPIALPMQAIQRQDYSLAARGIVPVANQERDPRPIQTTLDLPYTIEDRVARERNIMRIFKIDYIEAVQQATLGNLEAQANKVAALGEIAPLVQDFMARAINMIVDRVHSLLTDHDKEYGRAAAKIRGGFRGASSSSVLNKAKRALDAARFTQSAIPLLQIDPSSVIQLDVENMLVLLARSHNLPEVLKSAQEVAEDRKAMIQQQQAQQNIEQEQVQSQTAMNQAKADQLEQGEG